MAIENATGSGLSALIPNISTSGILSGIMQGLIYGVILIIIIFIVIWWWKKRRYGQYKIVIWEKDSTGNTHEIYDRAGIFLDKKTGFKLLFLEKMRKGLNPNNVPYVTSKDKKGRLIKTVYLRKTGVSNYVFCHVKIDDEGAIFKVGEEDVNWAAQDIETIRRTFNKESWLTKLAPYIMFVVTVMIIMIILLSLFNKFESMEKMSENMLKVTEKQLEITGLLGNMTRGQNIVNPGQPIIVPGVP
jgi:hypothetical protein